MQENNTLKRQDISWNWKLKIPGHVIRSSPTSRFIFLRSACPSDNLIANFEHRTRPRFSIQTTSLLFRSILRRKISADGHNSIEISRNVVPYWLYQIYWIFPPSIPPSMTIGGDSWSFSCLWSKHRSTLEYRGNHGTFLLSRLLDKGYDPHAHRQRNESIPLYKRQSNTGSASHPSETLISCGISWRFETKLRSLFRDLICAVAYMLYNDL